MPFDRLTQLCRALLYLYPSDLRKEYGEDMANAFQQLVCYEYARHGKGRALAISAYTLGEFFTVALPRHFRSDWLIASLLSLIITSGVLGSLVGVMTAQVHINPINQHVMVSCR